MPLVAGEIGPAPPWHLELRPTRGGEAPALLLDAARALTRLDPPLARETYLEAVQAAGYARTLAAGETVGSIARAALAEAPSAATRRSSPISCDRSTAPSCSPVTPTTAP